MASDPRRRGPDIHLPTHAGLSDLGQQHARLQVVPHRYENWKSFFSPLERGEVSDYRRQHRHLLQFERQLHRLGLPAKQKWTRKIPGTGKMSSKTYYRNDSTLTRGGRRYAWVYNAIINIDNGETLILGGGSKVDSDLTSTFFKDGWGTFEVKNGESEADDTDSDSPWSTTYKVTIYDFTGKKRSSFTETITLGEQVVIGESELITAEEYRTYFKDQDYSKAKLTSKVNANGCITKLKPKDRKPISIQPPDNSSGLSYDWISPSCASVATSPQGSDIVRLATLGRGDINGLTMLMNIKTGEEITFNGIDWNNGDSLIIAKPDLIIGYNKFDGKVIGFKPAS